MEQDVLGFLNKKIREQHGNRVTIESKWIDADIDSFGTTVVFLEMDDKYGKFSNDWFRSLTYEDWRNLTVAYIIERALDESIIVQSNPAE